MMLGKRVVATLVLCFVAKTKALDCNAWEYDCPKCKPWEFWCDTSCQPKKDASLAAAGTFLAYTGSIEAFCANDILSMNERGNRLIEEAKRLLDRKEVFQLWDFKDIEIRFCTYLGDFAGGMVPSSNKILVNGDYLNKSASQLAVLLAHEMIHIQQHERWSSIGFACRYQEELWSGHGFRERNSIEKEAYDFDAEVELRLRGIKLALRVHDGSYVTAQQGGGGAVTANAPWIKDWEIFWLIKLEGDKKYAFQTRNYHYLHAPNGGGGIITAQGGKALEWESFLLESVGGGRFSLQVYNGLYVAAKDGGGDVLEANRASVNDWEKFRFVFFSG